MPDDPYRYFRLEARELLDQFGPAVLELDKRGGGPQVQRILRLAHTLKGAARVVKQREIADGAHAIEEALSPFRDAIGSVPRDAVNAVFGQLDAISDRVVALESPRSQQPDAAGGATPAQTSQPAEEPIRTVRADVAEMDALLDGIAESHVVLNGLRTTLAPLEQIQHLADLVAEQLAPRNATDSVRADQTYALADDLRRRIGTIERGFNSAVDLLDRELRQLRETAEQLRLAPAASLFTVLERTVRDSAQALSKEVVFEAHGGDIRLDADILAIVQGALVQIVRNCVAHGIEPPRERAAAGKEAAGRIRLDVARRGNRIVFICEDDGRGIDLNAIRRAALRRGLASQTVEQLSGQQLINLMLRGGISTAGAVTEFAGRGVGLDVVREASERLGGTVAVTTEGGKGTIVELAALLSLISIEALLVDAGGTIASVPLDAVRSTMLLGAAAVSRVGNGAIALHQEVALPFLWLPGMLGGEFLPDARNWPTIVVEAAGGTVAVGVDRLLGTARIVVRSLPELAAAGPIVAGASLDAEGNPQLVLSPENLVAQALLPGAAEPAPERTRRPVLVIDDSLTTRMLEQSILESAGYEVDLAVSAEDALEIARRKRYALFLVDVEMPGMDGFSFVERTRADPDLREVPAVLVTSRAAPEDRQRGRDVGAHGYIVKGEFNQAELLAMIRPLIG